MANKKPQTEAKAKGLVKNVGDYKGRTLNLTKKQLGKAGTKAASARTVDISQTRYEGKKVLGPKGKPLTGRVDLGGGNIAVYKNGVRVRAAANKPSRSVTGSGKGKDSTKEVKKVGDRKATSGTVSAALSAKAPRKSNRSATSGTVTSAKAKGKSMGRQFKSGTVSGAISGASKLTAAGEWLKGLAARQEQRPKGYKNPYKTGY